MNGTFHTQNNATDLTPPADAGAAPIDPAETASRGKPPGQTEAGVQKPGASGTLPGDEPIDDESIDDESVEEYDDPDGSLDAFD
jgi:hypothetical protein